MNCRTIRPEAAAAQMECVCGWVCACVCMCVCMCVFEMKMFLWHHPACVVTQQQWAVQTCLENRKFMYRRDAGRHYVNEGGGRRREEGGVTAERSRAEKWKKAFKLNVKWVLKDPSEAADLKPTWDTDSVTTFNLPWKPSSKSAVRSPEILNLTINLKN